MWRSIILLALIVELAKSQHCEVTLPMNLSRPSKSPLVVQSGKLLIPPSKNGKITLLHGTTVDLICPGVKNNVEMGGTNSPGSVSATCQNVLFTINTLRIDFASIACTKPPVPDLEQSNLECIRGNNSINTRLAYIGYKNPSTSGFVSNYTVCFDGKQKYTYWTRHDLIYHSPYSCVFDYDIWTQRFFGYKKLGQIKRAYSEEKYDRGHLVPFCDYITAAEKRMTLFYENCAPQNPTLNRQNWKQVEISIRGKVRSSGNQKFYVYTGSYGGAINLMNDTIPIPTHYWKIVIDPYTGKSVGFIGLNEAVPTHKPLCTDVCNRLPWVSYMNVSKGVVYCCKVEDVMGILGDYSPPALEKYNPRQGLLL